MSTITGIDHVQLAMPHGGESHARRFWIDLMGLKEVAKPANLAVNGGCWFEGERIAIHCGVEEGFLPARRAHPALLVSDLAALVERLGKAGSASSRARSWMAISGAISPIPSAIVSN
jgi:catechol 2,3-dioxygenase-like lactoylglutathione lyase family enzyme